MNTGRQCTYTRLEVVQGRVSQLEIEYKIEQPNQRFEYLIKTATEGRRKRTTMATKPLHVTVVSAYNLPAGNHVDPYCCVALQPGPREHHFSHRHCHTKTRPITKARRFDFCLSLFVLEN